MGKFISIILFCLMIVLPLFVMLSSSGCSSCPEGQKPVKQTIYHEDGRRYTRTVCR